ncbi:MAG TPA: enoyl-CoA hydratase/isomerase family protein [Dehalococcoidia bacterium]|nr:enoyl-CoA hydratase/isomerase family protein [Dehalococcoidia bacterium]
MTTRLDLEVDGALARLTLAAGDGENRIEWQTISELQSLCTALAEMPELRALIVQGEGGNFCRGWSASLLADAAAPPELRAAPGDPFGCLAELPLPVIAAIEGDCLSAGLELALACDLRVAAGTARFALPESEFGLIPLAGGTQRLPRLVGHGRALAMVLLGQTIDGVTAEAWGLVNALAGEGGALAQAERLAATIAARGPIAERFAKEAVQNGSDLPLTRALRYELDLTVLLQTTEDRAEGVRAFTEKRPPEFHGR